MVVNNKILKGIFWTLFLGFVFINSIFLNVVLHEIGHYAAAGHFGLKPEIKFELDGLKGIGFNLIESAPLATTNFIDNGNNWQLIVIVLMGVFMNLILGVCFLGIFIYFKDKDFIRDIGLIGFVVSIGSFLMNLIPLNGADGSIIFGLIGI